METSTIISKAKKESTGAIDRVYQDTSLMLASTDSTLNFTRTELSQTMQQISEHNQQISLSVTSMGIAVGSTDALLQKTGLS